MSEQLQIPVELPVESVKAYVQGEQITPYNFDLLQNYFEGRIIKLLEEDRPFEVGDKQDHFWAGYHYAVALIKASQKDNEIVVLLTEGEK